MQVFSFFLHFVFKLHLLTAVECPTAITPKGDNAITVTVIRCFMVMQGDAFTVAGEHKADSGRGRDAVKLLGRCCELICKLVQCCFGDGEHGAVVPALRAAGEPGGKGLIAIHLRDALHCRIYNFALTCGLRVPDNVQIAVHIFIRSLHNKPTSFCIVVCFEPDIPSICD